MPGSNEDFPMYVTGADLDAMRAAAEDRANRGGLWRNTEGTLEGKYLVLRRDGTVPEWPAFVLGARDPAAPAALRAYAEECKRLGFDARYVSDVRHLADDFEAYRLQHGDGDPDRKRHRIDDPTVVARMREVRDAGGGSA